MSSTLSKRIMSEIRELIKDKFDNGELDIFVKSDENDITNMYILIIGTKNTPYYGGFYYFKVKYPTSYPNDPPKVTFFSSDGHIRFNPNLYVNGKVCLSILNTWDGPSWTPCYTIKSVILSIQSMVMNEEPLCNEPGYENANENILLKYRLFIEYANFEVAVIKMLQKPPIEFEIFREEIEKYFIDNYHNYVKRFKELNEKLNSKSNLFPYYSNDKFGKNYFIQSGVYGMKLYLNINNTKLKMESLYVSLCNKYNLEIKIDNIDTSKITEIMSSDIQKERDSFRKNTKYDDISKLASKLKIECTISKANGKGLKKKTKKELLDEIDNILSNKIY